MRCLRAEPTASCTLNNIDDLSARGIFLTPTILASLSTKGVIIGDFLAAFMVTSYVAQSEVVAIPTIDYHFFGAARPESDHPSRA